MASNRFRSLLLIIALPQVIAAPSFLTGRDTDTIADQFLTAQNTLRAEHGVANFTWNSTLADYAAQWASNCVMASSSGPYGEIMSGSGPFTVQDMVNYWIFDSPSNPDRSFFNQIIWKSSTEVGCAISTCAPSAKSEGRSQIWFCEYYPPGNVEGKYSENIPLCGVSHKFVGG